MHGKVHCILPSRWSDTGTFGCGPGGRWRHITELLQINAAGHADAGGQTQGANHCALFALVERQENLRGWAMGGCVAFSSC